jgi:Chaperone of endosialidase
LPAFVFRLRLTCLIAALLIAPQPGFAACSSPAGTEGEIAYNSSYHVMQFCDGSAWISMAAAATYLSETDPKVGTLTALKWCATNAGGTAIDCTQDAPLRTGNNLSDLASASTARTNLGLGTIATQAASSVTITGGTINGTVIGGTTAAAGVFTMLSASGAATLSSTLNVTGTITGPGSGITALNANNLASGTVPTARLGSGTANGSSYLRGDQSWTAIALSGLSDVSLASPATNQILSYSGSTWTNASVGSLVAGVAGPSFHVHKNNVNQAMSSVTKLTWSTEEFDTNNNFASDKFTPTVAGKYVLTATVSFQLAATNYFALYLYKNGVGIKTVSNVLGGSNPGSVTLTAVVDANGTTDYFEVYAYNSANAAAEGNTSLTYFSGSMMAPLASGVVAGTGSAGYVPVWTSGNAITYDSTAGGQFAWDLTNHRLGIGTAAPTNLLTVGGGTTPGITVDTPSTTGRSELFLAEQGVTQAAFQWRSTSNGTYPNTLRLGTTVSGADTVIMSGASNHSITVKSTGNVGIGTTVPGYKFVVQDGNLTTVLGADSSATTLTNSTDKAARIGSPHYTNAEEPAAALFVNNSSGNNNLMIGGGTSLMNASTVIGFYTAANTTTTTGTERMRISSSGNVAIGTTSPSTKAILDLYSTTLGFLPPRMTTAQRDAISSPATGLTVYNSTTNALNIYNGSAWGAVGGGGTLAALTDTTITSPANNDILRYNGSAWVNVPINTAMTTTTMEANWPDAIRCNPNTVAPTSYYTFYLLSANGGNASYGYVGNGSQNAISFASAASNGALANSNYGWNTAGACGTTISNIYAAGLAFNFIGTGAVTTFDAGSASAPGLAVTSDTNTGLWSAGADTLNISTGGTERLRIDSSGNVGIGTASPAAKLDVAGDVRLSAAGPEIEFNASGPRLYSSAANTLAFHTGGGLGSANNEVMRMTATGLGIGTTAPAESLHLRFSGTADDVHGLRIEDYRPHINLLDTTTSANDFQIKVDGDRFQINRDADGTTFADTYFTILGASGAVGIGTTNPGAQLDVRETNTATSGNEYLNYSAFTVNPASASTAVFWGDHVQNAASGSSDISTLYGQSAYLYHNGTGTITTAIGSLGRVHNNSSGTITSGFGAYNDSQVLSTSTTTTAYGAYNRAYSAKASGTAITSATGGYNIVYNNGAGAITNSYGSQNVVLNNAAGALTNAYGALARVDNASTGTVTTAYSLRADFVNDGGGAVTTWHGLSIPAVTGVAATNEWPVYISHTGRNYFAGTIGVGTNNPAASSLVELQSTTKGFLPPRMTTAQRDAISSPATGLVVYNTTTNALNVRGASSWGAVGGGAIADASDTTITSPANNDILRYNGSAWVNTPINTAMTTTTMVANWPDAIQCYGATGFVTLFHSYSTASNEHAYVSGYTYSDPTQNIMVVFNSSGAMTSIGNIADWTGYYLTNCNGASGNSIAQLYAAGRAFNFIGTGAVTTFNVGTASAPGLAVTTDTNTGFYQATADTLSITAGGVEAARFNTVASGQNYFNFTPSASTNTVTLASAGGGATVPITIDAKGTSSITLSDATTFSSTTAHTGAASFSSTITGATGVGIGTTSVAASSVLDMVSTTKGFLPPRMTTAQRDAISSPATGLTVYNSTTNVLNVYNGSAWGAVGGGGTLAALTDTTITSPANGHVLQYNGSAWTNVAAQTAMGTTTMTANWPDALTCTFTTPAWGRTTLGAYGMPWTPTGNYTYMAMYGAVMFRVAFNSGGTLVESIYYDGSSWTTATSDCTGQTIAQNYAAGRAWNFIGTGAVTTFNVGTASAPGLAVTSDTNTGIWSAGADTLNFSTGGTERLRISSSGNVGIGTTSPGVKLDVATAGSAANETGFILRNPSTAAYSTVNFDFYTAGAWKGSFWAMRNNTGSGGVFGINTADTSGVGQERMRIAETGNVGIGTSSPSAKLDVSGLVSTTGNFISPNDTWIYSWNGGANNGAVRSGINFIGGGSSAMALYTGGSERMNINSSGRVGIGTNAAGHRLDVRESSTSVAAFLGWNTGANYYCYIGYQSSYSLVCSGPTSGVSDGRLKKDIVPLGDAEGLSAIMALQPVHYRWKDERRNPGGRHEIGFIAQNVESVLPELVGESEQPVEPGKPAVKEKIKSLSYERLAAPIVKAVQELKALFDALGVKVEKLIAEGSGHDEAIKKLQARNASLEKANELLRDDIKQLHKDLNELHKVFEAFKERPTASAKATPRADNDNDAAGGAALRGANDNEPMSIFRKASGNRASANRAE